MIQFQFEFLATQNINSSSLGHISIRSQGHELSTKNNHACMLLLTLLDTMDGVLLLYRHKEMASCSFNSVGSSFNYSLKRTKEGMVIVHSGKEIGTIELHDFAQGLISSIDALLMTYTLSFEQMAPIKEDFQDAYFTLKEYLT